MSTTCALRALIVLCAICARTFAVDSGHEEDFSDVWFNDGWDDNDLFANEDSERCIAGVEIEDDGEAEPHGVRMRSHRLRESSTVGL